MRPSKPRPPSASSSHLMKCYRRCHFGSSQLDTSLRVTSLFVIAVAFCEFSGISQALMDVYASVSTPRSAYISSGSRLRSNTAFDFPRRLQIQSPSAHQMGQATHVKQGLPHRPHKKPALKNLYVNIDPTMTMGDYVNNNIRSAKVIPKSKPRFQLEMHWTDENFRDKTCRIHNACMEKDGSVLVHPWMKAQERHLRECGVRRIKYMKSEAEYNINDVNRGTDLIGVEPSRYHIPHFLTDILPMIYSSELLRPRFTQVSFIKSVCEAPGNRRCNKEAIQQQLNPSLYAEQRISVMPVSAWVPQLVAMLPGNPGMHFAVKMFSNSTKPLCFRSVVAFNKNRFMMQGSHWFGDENPIFRRNGMTRASAKPVAGAPPNIKVKACKKKVTILNRVGWTKRSEFLLGRDIVNVDQVVDQVEQISRFKGNENLDLSVSIEYFENMSFIEQVEVMQKADVLLGVHGAGLGNMLFARQDVPLLEVLPFGYYAGPFNGLAAVLNLEYASTIAEPDTVSFKECIELRADKLARPDIARTGMKIWNEAVKKRKAGDWYSMLAHRFTSPELVPVKLCARSQRMKVNALETARKLVNMAQVMCGNGPNGRK